MELGCSTLACTLGTYPTLDSAFTKISSLGFAAVDIALFHNWQHVSPSEIAHHAKAWATRIGESLNLHGLQAISINCGMSTSILDSTDTSRSQYEIELKALLALARSIGCPNLTINPGGKKEVGDNIEHVLDPLRDRLRYLAELAKEVSVTLSLEGHEGSVLEHPKVAYEFVAGLWPDIGYTFDPSHMIMQGFDPFHQMDLLGKSHHVHVRNAAIHAMQAPMATGSLDVKRLFDTLHNTDYSGNIGIEYFDDFDPDFSYAEEIKTVWNSVS